MGVKNNHVATKLQPSFPTPPFIRVNQARNGKEVGGKEREGEGGEGEVSGGKGGRGEGRGEKRIFCQEALRELPETVYRKERLALKLHDKLRNRQPHSGVPVTKEEPGEAFLRRI